MIIPAAGVIVLVAGLVAVGIIDARTMRLPNRWTRSLAFVSGLVLLALLLRGDVDMAVAGLVGAATFTGVLAAAHVMSPGNLGFGDVKLAPTLGTLVGLTQPSVATSIWAVLWALLFSCLLFVIQAGVARVRGSTSRRFPFGPSLIVPPSCMASIWVSLAVL